MSCPRCGHKAERLPDGQTVQPHNLGCPASLRAHARNLVEPDFGQSLDALSVACAVLHTDRDGNHIPCPEPALIPEPAAPVEDKCARDDCTSAKRAYKGSGQRPKYCDDHSTKRSK